MKWVEKSRIEKIRQLLEISERERHYQVLLTRENISAMRHNPAPYTLPVIPRSLPSNVVEGEHFVIADVWRLVSGSASSSRDQVVEASSRVQGARSALRSSTSSSGGSGSSSSSPGQRARRDLSLPRSRSDPIGESEPVSGCETIYWESFFFFFFFLSELNLYLWYM